MITLEEKRTKDLRALIVRFAIIIASSTIIGSLILVLVYTIPDKAIEDNVRYSKEIIDKEAEETGWPRFFSYAWATHLDDCSDQRMLSDIIKGDTGSTVKAAFSVYSRYWNGYMAILRPAMIVLNYPQMRFFFWGMLFIGEWELGLQLYSNLGKGVSFSMVIALLYTNFILVPFNFLISFFMLIAVYGSIWVLRYYTRDIKRIDILTFFMIYAVVDAYFDMPINAPALVLGLPLSVLILLNTIRYGRVGIRDNLHMIFQCSASWGISLIVFWIMKWIIGSCILHENIFSDVLNEANRWTVEKRDYNFLSATAKNIAALLPSNGEKVESVVFLHVVCIAIMVLIFIVKRCRLDGSKRFLPLILIASFPFMWFFIMPQHSGVHATLYSYRSLLLPIFIFLSIYFYYFDKSGTTQ